MRTVYYLKTCNTCLKILKQVPKLETFELRELKANPITLEELEALEAITKSYETLFNKQSQQYKALQLKGTSLSEVAIKTYILSHYSFLKRPIFHIDNTLFIGNKPEVLQALLDYLAHE